jgi:hypothetical protein
MLYPNIPSVNEGRASTGLFFRKEAVPDEFRSWLESI